MSLFYHVSGRTVCHFGMLWACVLLGLRENLCHQSLHSPLPVGCIPTPIWGYAHWYLLLPPGWVPLASAVLFAAAGTRTVASDRRASPGPPERRWAILPSHGITAASCWHLRCPAALCLNARPLSFTPCS